MRTLLLIPLIAGTAAALTVPGQASAHQAHFEARKHPTDYHGPGREEAEVEHLGDVKIGYFGPFDPDHPEGGDAWLAAGLAIEEENRLGGYRGLPFRLVPGWSDSPWGSGITQVTRMVYRDRVWAIVGSIDGSATHLAEQVAAKARVTLLNPGSSDKTINLANVPWMFSCLPGEHLQVPVLVAELQRRFPGKAISILSSIDHDSRVFAKELFRHLSRRSLSPTYHLQFGNLKNDPLDFLETVAEESELLFIVAGPRDSTDLLQMLRKAGFRGPVFGTASMGRRYFLERLPQSPGTLIFPLLTGKASESFSARFRGRLGRDPDSVSTQTYDAVRLLARAIRSAGLNRTLIRDAIREMAGWTGEAGPIDWDPLGHNRRTVLPATIRDGRVEPLDGPGDGPPTH